MSEINWETEVDKIIAAYPEKYREYHKQLLIQAFENGVLSERIRAFNVELDRSASIILTGEQADCIIGALDSLGVELTNYGHLWTDGERTIYERALTLLCEPEPTPLEITDNLP